MRIISFIEEEQLVKKILQRRTSPQTPEIVGYQAQTSSES